jgi:hypothetical protein
VDAVTNRLISRSVPSCPTECNCDAASRCGKPYTPEEEREEEEEEEEEGVEREEEEEDVSGGNKAALAGNKKEVLTLEELLALRDGM